MPGSSRQARGEAGFSLIEMAVVMIIVAILVAAAWVAMERSAIEARATAVRTAAASIDSAVGAFQKIYPPVAGTDELMTRAGGAPWDGTEGPADGMFDLTGEPLLAEWPNSPYVDGGIPVHRTAGCAAPSGDPAGQIAICRTDPARAASYRVVAWARDGDGNPYIVYDQSH